MNFSARGHERRVVDLPDCQKMLIRKYELLTSAAGSSEGGGEGDIVGRRSE
jgi:hypothetical protein